jgi:hypothetical protein
MLNIDSYKEFPVEDGYYHVTMSDATTEFNALINKALEAEGYVAYGLNRTGTNGKVTITYVTLERKAVLQEQHHASCRNSLGGISDLRLLGKLRDVQGNNSDYFKQWTEGAKP